MLLRPRESQIQDLSSNVIKEDINQLLRSTPELLGKVLVLVVQSAVKAELLNKPLALVITARDSNDSGSLELRNLTNDTACGTCSSRDDHEVASLDFADIDDAKVCLKPY